MLNNASRIALLAWTFQSILVVLLAQGVSGRSIHQAGPTLVMLHPMNSNGEGFRRDLETQAEDTFVASLNAAGVRVIFPDAPLGICPPEFTRCWHTKPWRDMPQLPEDDEPTESMASTYSSVVGPLLTELSRTVGLENVIVAGYSMGATMAAQLIHLAPPGLAGVAVVKGNLYAGSPFWKPLLEAGPKAPQVLLTAGTHDHVILVDNVWNTAKRMRVAGVRVTVRMNEKDHYLNHADAEVLRDWVLSVFDRRVPPTPSAGNPLMTCMCPPV